MNDKRTEGRELGTMLVLLFFIGAGLARGIATVLSFSDIDINVFLTPPYLLLTPILLSIFYIVAGVIIFKNKKIGYLVGIVAVVAYVSIEFYMNFQTYGFWFIQSGMVFDVLTIYSIDLFVLVFIAKSLSGSALKKAVIKCKKNLYSRCEALVSAENSQS